MRIAKPRDLLAEEEMARVFAGPGSDPESRRPAFAGSAARSGVIDLLWRGMRLAQGLFWP